MNLFGKKEKGTKIFDETTQPTTKDYFIVYDCFAKGEYRATGNAEANLKEIKNYDKVAELEGMILQDALDNNPTLFDVDCVKITFIKSFPL